MILKLLVPLLLCSLYCSAQQNMSPPPTYKIDKDWVNWRRLYEVQKNSATSRADNDNVFDKILKVNAMTRGQPGLGRTDGVFLYQGDIKMRKNDIPRLFVSGQQHSRTKRAVIKKTSVNLWRKNIRYALDSSLNNGAKAVIRGAIAEWRRTLPCMGTWTEVSRYTRRGDIMYFFSGGGCYSQVGRVGGVQKVSIGRGCAHHGIVVHEIGHAMGLWHEQSRPDRDGYVNIHWGNIMRGMEYNFRKQRSTNVYSFGVGYDYGSVMHYGSRAFSRNGQSTITAKRTGIRSLGQRRGLSASDKKQVQLLYGCRTTKPTGCNDKDTHRNWCTESSKLGLCQNSLFKSYMLQNCCRTCSRPVSKCSDKNTNCNRWKGQGYCSGRYQDYMRRNCAKACGACR